MADNKDNTKAKSNKIKEEDISTAPGFDMSEMISQTVSKTIEGLAPFLKQNSKKPETLKNEGQNIRSKIMNEMNKDFDHVRNANKRYLAKLANTPKSEMVIVRIPRVYAKYLGSVIPVALNGSVISIPVNNKPYRIPKVMKPILDKMLAYEDEKISFMEKTDNSDIAETREGTLGR